jgi:peptidoglycan hydrolase-like protein with peptidoglycan-binding domain
MALSQNQIRQMQQALDQKGFKSGRTDGKLGPETKQALTGFQKSQNLQQSGQPDQQTLAALGIKQSGSTAGRGSSGQPMPHGQDQPSQSPGAKSPNGK